MIFYFFLKKFFGESQEVWFFESTRGIRRRLKDLDSAAHKKPCPSGQGVYRVVCCLVIWFVFLFSWVFLFCVLNSCYKSSIKETLTLLVFSDSPRFYLKELLFCNYSFHLFLEFKACCGMYITYSYLNSCVNKSINYHAA